MNNKNATGLATEFRKAGKEAVAVFVPGRGWNVTVTLPTPPGGREPQKVVFFERLHGLEVLKALVENKDLPPLKWEDPPVY